MNRTLFENGAGFPGPSLWIYGARDRHYRLEHGGANFDGFRAAGGTGTMIEADPPPGVNGHFVGERPELWTTEMEAFLGELRG